MLWLGLPALCWIRVVRMIAFVLFLILEKNLSVFHSWIWCYLHICCIWLYYVEVYSFSTQCVEDFHHERMLYFVKYQQPSWWEIWPTANKKLIHFEVPIHSKGLFSITAPSTFFFSSVRVFLSFILWTCLWLLL